MKNEDLEKYRPLLMGLMDGELSSEEAVDVNEALNRSADLRAEYEKIREGTGKLDALSLLEPSDEIARRLWKSPSHRFLRNNGVLMIVGGYILLILYAVYEALMEDGPVIPNLAGVAIILGTVALFISFIRERMETHKVDPYKDIER